MTLRTPAEIASDLRVHPETVRRWVRRGAPHYRMPGRRGRILLDVGQLLDWLRRTRL